MSDTQVLEPIATKDETPVVSIEKATKQNKPEPTMKYHEYVTALEKDAKIFELRARIAKAQFEELQSANHYNQLRAHLESQALAAQAPQAPQAADTPDAGLEQRVQEASSNGSIPVPPENV